LVGDGHFGAGAWISHELLPLHTFRGHVHQLPQRRLPDVVGDQAVIPVAILHQESGDRLPAVSPDPGGDVMPARKRLGSRLRLDGDDPGLRHVHVYALTQFARVHFPPYLFSQTTISATHETSPLTFGLLLPSTIPRETTDACGCCGRR